MFRFACTEWLEVARKKRMSLKAALEVLMKAAVNDARGSGLGYRSTADEWRDQLAEAWAVAHKRVYGWEPMESEYFNAGMRPPAASNAKVRRGAEEAEKT